MPGYFARSPDIDAAVFIDCRSCYAVSRGAVHIDLGRLRYGAGCAGYGQLLVRFRADGNTADDPDMRAWCCDSCGIFRYAVRQKNIADAAQYHAGRHLCPEGRRDRPPDPLYCTGNFSIELIGTIVMLPTFCGNFGIKGIWMAAFHSISAFCNAGFDILGTAENKYPSLTGYIGEPTINIAIMLLIIVGGIGFLTWDDIYTNKWHFKKYRMQSKVILVTTAILIIAPAVFFFFCDFTGLPLAERILASLFQSVTPRTAGFNTADLPAMTGSSKAIMILLMLVGGSPGSTAGGMKTTTLAVLILSAFSVCRKKDDAEVCGRRIDGSAVKNAAAVAVMYFLLFFVGGIVISTAEDLPLSTCLYETASAVGTVGLTLGITPQLGVLSQLILIVLMYLGRVGGLTLIYAAISNKNQSGAKLPLEKITVG